MSPENFCYWLRGYLELNSENNPGFTPEQVRKISEHLSLVLREVPKDGMSGEVFAALKPISHDILNKITSDLICERVQADSLQIDPNIRCALTC